MTPPPYIVPQAVEEYKQTNGMQLDEVGLLDRFLANLSSAVAPTKVFGASLAAPNAPAADAAAAGGPDHLIEEITDAPQLFECVTTPPHAWPPFLPLPSPPALPPHAPTSPPA